MGRTVTPLAYAYVGSNPTLPTFKLYLLQVLIHSVMSPVKVFNLEKSGSSSVGRATAFQAVGRGFEPRLPLVIWKLLSLFLAQKFFWTSAKKSRCSSGVERFLGKEEVTGSIPVIGSIQRKSQGSFIWLLSSCA